MEVKKYLDKTEIAKLVKDQDAIAFGKKNQELLAKDHEIMKLKTTVNKLSIDLLSYQMRETSQKLNDEIRKVDSFKKSHKDFKDTLHKKYDVKPGFGYNPDTGELV